MILLMITPVQYSDVMFLILVYFDIINTTVPSHVCGASTFLYDIIFTPVQYTDLMFVVLAHFCLI